MKHDTPPQPAGFRRIGDILKADIDRALAARDEEAASDAHEALLDLEHRDRVAETVRKHSR